MTTAVSEKRSMTAAEKQYVDSLIADTQAKHRAACDLDKDRIEVAALKEKLSRETERLDQVLIEVEKERQQLARRQAELEERTRARERDLARREAELANALKAHKQESDALAVKLAKHAEKVTALKNLLAS